MHSTNVYEFDDDQPHGPDVVGGMRVLQHLRSSGGIEFVSSHGVSALAGPAAALFEKEHQDRGRIVSEWLLDQPEVADLFVSDETLEAVLQTQWDQKTVRPVRAPKSAADQDALERLLKDPEDRALLQVYSDWLQEREDPLGELIARQLTQRSAEDYLAANAEAILGRLTEYVPAAVRLRWSGGFIRGAKLGRAPDDRSEYQGAILLGWLLERPAAQLLHTLELHAFDGRPPDQYAAMLSVLLGAERPALRVLSIGPNPDYEGPSASTGPLYGGDCLELNGLSERLPQLVRFEARVPRVAPGLLNLPNLERLLLPIGNQAISAAAVARGHLPELRQLTFLRPERDPNNRERSNFGSLLDVDLPKLSHLSIHGAHDALIEPLYTARFAAQLEHLDLSGGRLSDEGALLLCERSRFPRLSTLDLRSNRIGLHGAQQVRACYPFAKLEGINGDGV